MSRRYLKLFPEPVLDIENSTEKGKKVWVTAEKRGEVLEIAVFLRENRPVYRIFLEKNNFTTYVTGEDRFSIKSIYDLDYRLAVVNVDCEECSENLIRQFFHEEEEKHSVLTIVSEHQQVIKRQKLEKKHLSEEMMLDEEMKNFRKPIPKGYKNFVRNKVFSNDFVLFYCRKDDYAYCTKCGTWHKYSELQDKPKIGKTITCPTCKTRVRCRARITGNSQTVCKWSLLVQTDGNNKIFFRYFCHRLTIKGTEPGLIHTKEMQRSINDVYGTKSYMWDDFHKTGKMRWCKYHDPSGLFAPSMWTYPTKGICVYQRGLDKVLKVERYRYSAFDQFCKTGFFEGAYTPENYLGQFLKKPFLEKLVKEGFNRLVSHLMDPWYGEKMMKMMTRDARNIKKLLGIDGTTLKRMKHIGDPTYEEFCILKEFRILNDRNLNRLVQIPKVNVRTGRIRKILSEEGITATKFINYVERNCLNDIDLYLDYLENCFFLEYPRIPAYMYPRNLMEMHDNLVMEKIAVLEQREKEALEKKSKELSQLTMRMEQDTRFHMENDAYVIVLPKDYAALQNESKMLNHCVRTYIDLINNGSTMIFFIRKKEEPGTPFFTLEIDKDLNLVQCRTKHNKKAVEFDKEKGTHVQAFAESFQQQLVNSAMAS